MTLLRPRLTRHMLVALVLLATTLVPARAQAAETTAVPSPVREYTFGVFPFLPQSTLERIFAPMAAELAAALGVPVHHQSAANFDKFTANLVERQYDIAHIHAFDYVRAAAKAGYLPVATRTEKVQTVIVVDAKSEITKADELRGKKLGLPPKVGAVSALTLVTLLQTGITPNRDVSIQHFSTPQACIQGVLIGDIDACATGRPAARLFEVETGQPLRGILTSPEIPQTLFVVHQRVPAKEREIIRETLIASRLNGVDPKLRNIFHPDEENRGAYFRDTSDAEYDIVRHYEEMLTSQ